MPETGRDFPLERPLELGVKAGAFVVRNQPGQIVRLAPGKLESNAKRVIHVPEKIGVKGRVVDAADRHWREVLVIWIINRIAGVRMHAGRPERRDSR